MLEHQWFVEFNEIKLQWKLFWNRYDIFLTFLVLLHEEIEPSSE